MEHDSNSSHEHRKWSMLPPHRRSRSEVVCQERHPPDIPEDEEPPILTKRPDAILPPSSTPPKKTWERHFRSFLSKRGSHESPDIVSALDPSQLAANHHIVSSRSKFSLVPGSRRLLMRNSSDGALPPVSPSIAAAATLPKTKSSADMTVKGGNFFSHVFQKDAGRSPVRNPPRKTKSMDTLDLSLRKGQEKNHSPKLSHATYSQEDVASLVDAPFLPGGNASMQPQTNPPPLHHRSPEKVRHAASNLTKALEPGRQAPLQPKSPQGQGPSSLPTALAPSTKTPASTEIKKAFTEFHNSPAFAKDSTSAYLGDDSSVSGNSHFAMYNKKATHCQDTLGGTERTSNRFPVSSRMISKSLDPVSEESFIHKSQRMLKPVAGPETWIPGRRYLIAPAVLATCAIQVLPSLSGPKRISTFDDTIFGILELGDATISYVGNRKESNGWSACTLVLRQNYLLEYDRESGVAGIPRGFAHLQYAKASAHQDFNNALELDFFGSPCAKSDKRKLLIRVERAADRDRWVSCLNGASKLTVHDLYDFDESKCIGQGRYASVYKARRIDKNGDSVECAIKVVDKSEFWSRVVKSMERADTLVREASVQATLASKGIPLPTILKLGSLFETADNLVFEVELLEGTDLFRYVSLKGSLSESEAACIIRDVLVGLEMMCRFGVAHRDVKPANILMCDKAVDGVHVKIADFGMSTFAGVDGLLRGRCGTPGYVAPEIFSAGVNGGYGNKVDVFSTGVTLYIMLCGYEPFYGETDAELINANREAVVEFPDTDWGNVSQEARDLVRAMLEADPTKRISAKDALQHPWICSRTVAKPVELPSKDVVSGAACVIS